MRIINKILQDSKYKDIAINNDTKFAINRVVSEFSIHILQFAANICEEENRTKITDNDVMEALKDLELQDWIDKIQQDKK